MLKPMYNGAMLKDKRLAIIGAGNMAEALLKGLLQADVVTPQNVVATGPRQERLDDLTARFGIQTTRNNSEAVALADIVLLSVKPQILDRVLSEIAAALPPQALIISVAAGVPIDAIAARLNPHAKICRSMPNTPARVGAGATAIAGGTYVDENDMACVQEIFKAVGFVTQVDETQLDAVTGLSGSGPAYVFMIIEALADAGVKVGLPRYKALALAAQTVLGSAKLLIETGEHPGVLKDSVTSPGGTAIAGLHTLEEGGLRTTLINAVVAASKRAQELGDSHLQKIAGKKS
jgi:pyrroline-5-carboxylate reductase